jgi:gamma-glutamyltranspeptidase
VPSKGERAVSASGKRFAIATPHWAATQAGVAAFDAGGNAVDAALAAAVTLAVVYPHMCGLGGDLFALVQAVNGQTIALNASGAAPRDIDTQAIRVTHDAMPEYGPLTITVPGAVSGWASLAELGADRPFERAFQPAIAHARDGIPVARSLASSLAWEPERLFADLGMREVFTHDGSPLAEGDNLVQPALATTLEAVAVEGSSVIYGGDVGARLVSGLRDAGSPMALEDLASHRPELDSPIAARYRDLHVSVVPPNSQGFALLEMLLAAERLEIDPDPLGADAALLAEVFAAASADRDRHNADPRFARVPVGTLLDEGHIASLCDQVRSGPVDVGRRRAGDTIALAAADGDGRAVSLIQSLSSGFGSGILEPSTGIICHNRGQSFSLDPESPNVLAGAKRPAHTLMPVLAYRDERLVAATGSMGGGGQPQINFQVLVRSFDLGMDPEAAVSAPRWLMGGMDLHPGRSIELEPGVPAWVREALERAGFALTLLGELDDGVGHAQLLRVAEDGTLVAATDPRADGEAAAR